MNHGHPMGGGRGFPSGGPGGNSPVGRVETQPFGRSGNNLGNSAFGLSDIGLFILLAGFFVAILPTVMKDWFECNVNTAYKRTKLLYTLCSGFYGLYLFLLFSSVNSSERIHVLSTSHNLIKTHENIVVLSCASLGYHFASWWVLPKEDYLKKMRTYPFVLFLYVTCTNFVVPYLTAFILALNLTDYNPTTTSVPTLVGLGFVRIFGEIYMLYDLFSITEKDWPTAESPLETLFALKSIVVALVIFDLTRTLFLLGTGKYLVVKMPDKTELEPEITTKQGSQLTTKPKED